MSQTKTFRIVEGCYHPVEYNDFKEDYLNPEYTALEIRKKHHLSLKKYNELREQVTEETGFRRVRGKNIFRSPMIYIKKTDYGKYRIDKGFKKQKFYCGTYDDLDTAIMVRDKLMESNWDKDVIVECMRKYGNSK